MIQKHNMNNITKNRTQEFNNLENIKKRKLIIMRH